MSVMILMVTVFILAVGAMIFLFIAVVIF